MGCGVLSPRRDQAHDRQRSSGKVRPTDTLSFNYRRKMFSNLCLQRNLCLFATLAARRILFCVCLEEGAPKLPSTVSGQTEQILSFWGKEGLQNFEQDD